MLPGRQPIRAVVTTAPASSSSAGSLSAQRKRVSRGRDTEKSSIRRFYEPECSVHVGGKMSNKQNKHTHTHTHIFTIEPKHIKHRGINKYKKKSSFKKILSSHCGSVVMNPTSIHEDVGSIPGLAWLSRLRIGVALSCGVGARIPHCCGSGVGRRLQLPLDP